MLINGTYPFTLTSFSYSKRRKTSYMCSTCGVPLCIKSIKGEDGNILSHHEKWHMIRNLIEEHRALNRKLQEYKDSRKRRRDEDEGDDNQEEEEQV